MSRQNRCSSIRFVRQSGGLGRFMPQPFPYGKLKDPFGHEWSLAMHQYDFTPEEMEKGAQEPFAHMPGCSEKA